MSKKKVITKSSLRKEGLEKVNGQVIYTNDLINPKMLHGAMKSSPHAYAKIIDVDTSEAKNYLLIVGINKYNHWPELNNAVNDANSVKEVLLRKYDFENAETTVLIDEDATRNGIYNAMRNYIELVGPSDNLMIYYAGHGETEVLADGTVGRVAVTQSVMSDPCVISEAAINPSATLS